MKKLILILGSLTLLGTSPIKAEVVGALSVGNFSCDRVVSDSTNDPIWQAIYTAYMEGYATSKNKYIPGKGGCFSDTSDSESRYGHVINYCRIYPHKRLLSAVLDLAIKYRCND